MDCPCHSGLSYEKCCQPFHIGKSFPENALQLMRSRFSAYALGLPEYIIATTHPENPLYRKDVSAWKGEILSFCKMTHFDGLDIQSFLDGPEVAFVSFFAHLKQNSQDFSFFEKSQFLKVNNHWLYYSGEVESPHF